MQYCPKCKIRVRGVKRCCPLCQGRLEAQVPDKVLLESLPEDAAPAESVQAVASKSNPEDSDAKAAAPEGSVSEKDAAELTAKRRAALIASARAQEDPYRAVSPFPVLAAPPVSGVSFVKICTFIMILVLVSMSLVNYLTGGTQAWPGFVQLIAVLAWIDLGVGAYFRNNIMKMIVVQEYFILLLNIAVDQMNGGIGWSFAWVVPGILVAIAITIVIVGKVMHLTFESYAIYVLWVAVFAIAQFIPIHYGWNPFPIPAMIVTALAIVFGAAVVLFRGRELRSAGTKWFNM